MKKVIDKAVLSANNSVSNEEDWVVEVNTIHSVSIHITIPAA